MTDELVGSALPSTMRADFIEATQDALRLVAEESPDGVTADVIGDALLSELAKRGYVIMEYPNDHG